MKKLQKGKGTVQHAEARRREDWGSKRPERTGGQEAASCADLEVSHKGGHDQRGDLVSQHRTLLFQVLGVQRSLPLGVLPG